MVVEPIQDPCRVIAVGSEIKEEGLYQQYAMLEGVEALTLAVFTRCLGWEPERVQVFLADVRKRYTYWPCAVIYGKKPEAVYSQ
ncbi:uncharacterized protein PV07_12230 [Cladophialophora immunda]|uniref:Uncharacterized protein n=1 Tax=Cladophialophora immunda TaxID=569365 RepID=A0A0D2BTE9_9EURO|nr:uncharacterized protein PV07_12230 [Cladophialophora immunda]KIW22333.1 hypothetical protein PV07_12230 [Cladophialophora immunda]